MYGASGAPGLCSCVLFTLYLALLLFFVVVVFVVLMLSRRRKLLRTGRGPTGRLQQVWSGRNKHIQAIRNAYLRTSGHSRASYLTPVRRHMTSYVKQVQMSDTFFFFFLLAAACYVRRTKVYVSAAAPAAPAAPAAAVVARHKSVLIDVIHPNIRSSPTEERYTSTSNRIFAI